MNSRAKRPPGGHHLVRPELHIAHRMPDASRMELNHTCWPHFNELRSGKSMGIPSKTAVFGLENSHFTWILHGKSMKTRRNRP